MTAIETDALTREFDDVVAVDDLSLTVDEGEVFGFLGPNGAGKSTTIDVLLGFLHPTAGSATIFDHDVTRDSRRVRERIGLLPEGYGLYDNLTGIEHLTSAIETKGADDDPDEIVERVGLDPDAARRAVGGYSTGMRQRIALGIALVGDPELLVLDEPSSGLDPNGVRRLRRIVREEAERGAAVFFSSHVLDEVERVCDRVGIMREGELVAVDTVDALRSRIGATAVVEASVDRDPTGTAVVDGSLAAVDGVTDVAVDDRSVEITCADPRAKMRALRLVDDAATVRDLAVEDASLESLFEAITAGDRSAVGSVAAADRGVVDDASGEDDDASGETVAADAGGERSWD